MNLRVNAQSLFPNCSVEVNAAIDEVLARQAAEDDVVFSQNCDRWSREDEEWWHSLSPQERVRGRAWRLSEPLRLLLDSGRYG